MEIIIALVALAIAYAVYKAYFAKSADPVVEVAPYKVEEVAVAVVAETAPAKKPRAKKAPAAAKKPAVKAKTATRKPKAK